jgi:hypothetical protein
LQKLLSVIDLSKRFRPPLNTLTVAEQHRLVDLIKDQQGNALGKDRFTEVVLNLLEDIAGFEHPIKPSTQRLINTLWRIYRAKNQD